MSRESTTQSRVCAPPTLHEAQRSPRIGAPLALLLILVPWSLAAQPGLPSAHPNLARGLSPQRSFDTDGFTRVNLFNGNLLLSIPLGLRYPVSSGFQYQLTLSYNSKVWDYKTVSGSVEADPLAWSNAGLGFDLSLGRLFAPSTNPSGNWLYVGFDGNAHAFYPTLHHDVPEPSDPSDHYQYSRDGSYLRLRRLSGEERHVERPDGMVTVFHRTESDWRVARQFRQGDSTNALTIFYAADGSSWTLTDSHGRQHVVSFRNDPSGAYPRLIDTIDLAGFAGARAPYNFDYEWVEIARACADRRNGSVTVPLLRTITDPLGQTRSFSHHTTGADCVSSGRLERAQFLSGGFWRWSYRSYSFPPTQCTGEAAPFLLEESGLSSRSLENPSGSLVGTWSYEPKLHGGSGACGSWRYQNVVTRPNGDQVVQHFAVANGSAGADRPSDYGLPITRETSDTTGARHLSTQIFDCDGAASNCILVRSRYQVWEQDALCTDLVSNCTDTNRRLSAQRTEFHDDRDQAGQPRFVDISRARFDGLGNYRVETRSSNFGRADHREVEIGYNLGNGTYPGSFNMLPVSSPWYLRRHSYRRIGENGGGIVHRETCFDLEGRLLRERLLNDDDTRTGNDIVRAYGWQGWDRVEEAGYGGDLQFVDPSVSHVCFLQLPASPQILERRTYEHGVLASTQDHDPSGQPMPFSRVDRDVDASTGLAATRRDSSGIATDLEYDLLGRLVSQKPESGHDAWIQRVYRGPTGGSAWSHGPMEATYRRPNGGGSALVTEVEWIDVFGRPSASERRLPSGKVTRERYKHDAQGHRYMTSTLHGPTRRWWRSFDLDPFGRPRRVRSPEGASHDELRSYRGIREVSRTVQAGFWYAPTGSCSERSVTYVTSYDGDGRVWRELEDRPWPAPGVVRESEHRYDQGGRTTFVDRRETVGGTTVRHWSSWEYDDRDFLIRNQTVDGLGALLERQEFSEHDPRGNPHVRTRSGIGSPVEGISVRMSYDSAGRTLSIVDASDPETVWKEFEYGSTNGPGDLRLGKLTTARRFNRSASGLRTVENHYIYGGRGGRPSAMEVTIDAGGPRVRSYEVTTAYDDLGRPISIGYPHCLLCAPGEPQLSRQISPIYDEWFLVSLDGNLDGTSETWLESMQYGADRTPLELEHGNGVRELTEPDPFGRARPSALRVSGDHLEHDSGTIVYDGEGQRCGIGVTSNVPVPVETPPTPYWDIPCADAATVDPFGLLTDEIRDSQCRGNVSTPIRIFDAMDRLVGFLDFRARKKVQVAGSGWIWMNDIDAWTMTWNLYGLDGQLLRRVVDGYADRDWRSTTDTIHALGRPVGQQERRIHENGWVDTETRYIHRLGRQTDEHGLPRDPLEGR